MTNQNNNVYIQSIEASDIYNHMIRDNDIKDNYVGMIPYSLELINLHKQGLSIKIDKETGKQTTDDIINLKFRQSVKNKQQIIKIVEKKITTLDENQADYIKKLEQFITHLQSDNDDKWDGLNNQELRDYIYINGFTINNIDYVLKSRSSSKSRKGEVLFIRKELAEVSKKWSQMGLDFAKGEQVDMASLKAYESLTSSSIIDTVQIPVDNILIIDDVVSSFKTQANVIGMVDNKLTSKPQMTTMHNDIWDGQSLLDSSYFDNKKGFMQLRHHFFKTAAFNTNIQQFLQDNCPVDIDYDKWELTNMFGQTILAKDVHMITTPNSAKFLSFADKVGSKMDMWDYWRELVENEGNTFGVCSYDEKSQRGYKDGKILNQTSYQMLNSLPLSEKNVEELVNYYERDYIDDLKNNDDKFIEHIESKVNEVNSNQMFVDLYNRNKDIVNTKIFRDFRKKEIHNHVRHVKRGKIRVNGDYAVIVSNPVEMLKASIGQYDVVRDQDKATLVDNQIYTTLFDFDKEVVGMRNPHTSQHNIFLARNTYNAEIEEYVNATDNIVVIGATNYPIFDILSGSDMDGDTMFLVDNSTILKASKKCEQFDVCVNDIDAERQSYELTESDMALVDHRLSQSDIGGVVNTAQHLMALYNDSVANNVDTDVVESIINDIEKLAVISGLVIDTAKRQYAIDADKEISIIRKRHNLNKMDKPLFFEFVSQSETINNRIAKYNTPMDYLQNIMDNMDRANYKSGIEFTELLEVKDHRKGNRRQQARIIEYVDKMVTKIGHINSAGGDKEEMFERLDNVVKYCEFYIDKIKVNENTMYAILRRYNEIDSRITTRLLKVLHMTQKDVFLSAFTKNG